MKTHKAAASHKATRTPRQQVAGLRQALPRLPKLLVVFLKRCCGSHNFDPMGKVIRQFISILETLLRVEAMVVCSGTSFHWWSMANLGNNQLKNRRKHNTGYIFGPVQMFFGSKVKVLTSDWRPKTISASTGMQQKKHLYVCALPDLATTVATWVANTSMIWTRQNKKIAWTWPLKWQNHWLGLSGR